MTPPAFDRAAAKRAGYTDAEIDAYLASRSAPADPLKPTNTPRVAAESSAMQGPGKAPARADADKAYVLGLLRQAGQGATFGFADEGEAAVRSLGGRPYREIRNEVREANQQFSQENPKASIAAQLVGGVATGGALGTAAKGTGAVARGLKATGLAPNAQATATMGQRLLQSAKVGGAAGAVGGAGMAEELRDVLPSAAVGYGVGGATGLLFGAASETLRGGRNLASRIGQGQDAPGPIRRAIRAEDPETAAAKKALARIGAQRQTLDQVAERSAAADGPDILAEVIGRKAERDVRAARALGYEAPDMIENSLLERARNDVGAVRRTVREELGEQLDEVALAEAKRLEAQQAAGPLYREAIDGVAVTDPRIPEMLKRPAISSAWNVARRMAANDGVEMPTFGQVIRNAAGRVDDTADEMVGGVATNAARTDGGSLRSFDKVSTADLVDELEALTTRQQRDMGQSVYNYTEIDQRGGTYGVVVPTATKRPGGGPSMQAKAQRRVDQTNGVIDRITEELDRRGVDWTEAMAKRATGQADDFAEDVARRVPGRGAVSLPDEAAAPSLPTVDGRQLQYVKLALRDQLTALEGKAGGTSTTQYAQVQRALDDVDNLLYEFGNVAEDGTNLWGAANRAYARPMQQAEAFRTGVRSGRQIDTPDVERLLSGPESSWTARGVANTIQDDLGRMGDGTVGPLRDPAPALMGSDAARARLRVAAGGDDAKIGRIQDVASNASRRLKTRQTVIGNSQTAEKLADQAEQGMDPSALLQAAQSPTGAVIGAIGRGANALKRNVVGQDMDALARLMMAGAPGQMTRQEAIASLQRMEPMILKQLQRQLLTRAVTGGLAGRAATSGAR